MLDERLLIAAICRSRTAYEEAKRIGVEAEDFSDAAAFLVKAAGSQYRRDKDLAACSDSVFKSQIERRYGDGSVARSILDYLDTLPTDVSGINVVDECRLVRLAKTATELATRFASHQFDERTQELLDNYSKLSAGLEEDDIAFRLEPEDFEEDDAARIPLWPSRLNAYIGGGVLRGHNITVYGRPDSGKSMFALNQAAKAISSGYKVLYIANEEPAQDITRRLLSRLCECDVRELRDIAHVRQAIDHMREAYDRWFLYHKAGVTAADIRRIAAKVRPDIIIVDQLKNVAIDDDNRALQLDKLARQVRELGISSNAVTISVTQAGESGHNKLTLGMGDIEWSNTGIPGAADLLIGIGVDDEYEKQRKRMLSIPKNKVNGKHGALPVWVQPEQTAFQSKPRSN